MRFSANQARVSALLRKHGDLPSLVVPAGTADGWRDVSDAIPPTDVRERAWRRELRREERRGAARTPWRGTNSSQLVLVNSS